jgi:serine/threonine protein kinase
MTEVRFCPQCQTEVGADAPEGLCPECLLRQALEGPEKEAEGTTGAWSPSPGFAPPAPAQLAGHFPHLDVLHLLGQGGMGAVYKARQTKLDRLVALKILPPEVARDPAFAERFAREARALARLNHSNIVTVHDFGEVEGLYSFTMEYVDGRNLRAVLDEGPLSVAQVRDIVPQICDALQYAHDEGLVHRDIKPENILVDRKGRVKIADFGLAKLVGLTPTYLTLTGTQEVMGTLLYMAPEQMKRTRTVDHRADLYSLGVVLYEMLTGELPLGRFAPPSHKAAVGEEVDQVVLRALAREPAERYQDASQLKHDLQAALPATTGAEGRRLSTLRRPAWPCARFKIIDANDHEVASGLAGRDEEALIVGIESAKKKYKAFFKEPGQPQEVRIPLHEIASLSYGCGWGQPPCALILRVTRLGALAGMPGSELGQVKLSIPREDRTEARRLVESIVPAAPAIGDPGQARLEVRAPALGLLVTGAATLVFWIVIAFLRAEERRQLNLPLIDGDSFFGLSTVTVLITMVSGVLMLGGLQMLRLRAYALAATAAIVAMIPWSPAWLIGLPFGIWACVVLGRPTVTEAVYSDRRKTASGLTPARKLGAVVARRFLGALRSVGRCFLPTMGGQKAAEADTGGPPG